MFRLALGSNGRIFKRETVPDQLQKLVQDLATPAYIVGARCDLLFLEQGSDGALHRPIDVQPYPIRLVNCFMSK